MGPSGISFSGGDRFGDARGVGDFTLPREEWSAEHHEWTVEVPEAVKGQTVDKTTKPSEPYRRQDRCGAPRGKAS